MTPDTVATVAVACPCGGYELTLEPGRPPIGARAAFTCPACGRRRTFTRTATGAVFDAPGPDAAPAAPEAASPATAPAAPTAPPAASPAPEVPEVPGAPEAPAILPPRPVPAEAAVVMTTALAPAWDAAVAEAFPAPDWHRLPAADDPRQTAVDVRFHRPRVVVAAGEAAEAVLTAVDALPGRLREAVTVILLASRPVAGPLAAFTARADVVCDAADTGDAAARLREAVARKTALPSLFAAS